MRFVGVSMATPSYSTAIGLSNNCKCMFNEVSAAPWCHIVVHFVVKMSHLFSHFLELCPKRSRPA